ncbi:assimilatory sulfite reductase (NADPH) flavoprotein subunit [Thiorhodococcus mannitoliphagus]|uniref:Sulfite reductase [NADPH] flavoprotein alpha-component n=1 Tax=Thiorhodococcus mannitoliphagus TaxID=329406 RepID=A0A6P1DRL6_9GAMM|nr:assimilatory sulfite reductase (NADPH) flavoprotein subunit [Thiorhodococcus mannitoliphagus]NEX20698.1 assimilatory sulfite reductase (NADPH) flavoprotein subunit [Thiorhodococcus mannitoliphagus]
MALTHLNALTSPVDDQQLRALEIALKDLSPTQIAWVSGYLAGVSRDALTTAATPTPAGTISLFYGSQTGNAKAVAERLGERLLGQELDVQVRSMGDFGPRRLTKERLVLFLVSTHGEGEPPDSARALHAFIHDPRAPRLEQLSYAVLGLGDSSYEHFCRTAVEFDRRLAELGARRILPLQCCDLDYQPDTQRWSADVLERLAQLAPARPSNVVALPGGRPSPSRAIGKDAPYPATLLENRRITTRDAVADVRHLALSIDPSALSYQPGDALGVWFHNDPALADAVLATLGLDGETPVRLADGELGLRQAMIERLELTQLHPASVRAWAGLAKADTLSALATDAAALRAYAGERQLIDLIAAHPARVDAETLVGLLRPLQPRLYSIASSQAECEDEVHLTVSVRRYQAHGRDHLGGASGFLGERLGEHEPVRVYVAENESFRLPANGDAPLILIGAGTGIAPYRAFLQQRAANGDQGRNWLVFGNRHYHRDFLYQLDWQAQRKAGLLHRVSLAFSRDGADKRYIQHSLREEGRELLRWIEDGAHLYVCGATAMGQAVHRALLDILTTEAGQAPEAAEQFLDTLRREARYHRDLYA